MSESFFVLTSRHTPNAPIVCASRPPVNPTISCHAVGMTSPRRFIPFLTMTTLVAGASRSVVDKHVRQLQRTDEKTTWTRFKYTNCYSGWGAKELDDGKDCGKMSLAECQTKCDELSGCMSITWNTVSQECFRRGYVRYTASACTSTRSYTLDISRKHALAHTCSCTRSHTHSSSLRRSCTHTCTQS